jgi:hypothetical protein
MLSHITKEGKKDETFLIIKEDMRLEFCFA